MFASAEEMNKIILDGFRKAKDLWDSQQWTDKPPTESGWYWVCFSRKGYKTGNLDIVKVVSDSNVGLGVEIADTEEIYVNPLSDYVYPDTRTYWLAIPEPEMPKG